MKKILVLAVVVVGLFACNKDKFKTEPQVEIKSLAPSEVRKGDIITFRAVVTDKEGDLQDSVLLVRKRFAGNTVLTTDTLRYNISSFAFPDKSIIEVTALFSYGELRDGYIFANLENQDREFAVGIIVRDKAGHRSEYQESERILLKQL
ncbi:MAG TPA: hypothetical protein VGC29_02920 [Flavisolibacter sp.]